MLRYKVVGIGNVPANYRPISILPTLSQIFEKVVLTQLLSDFKNFIASSLGCPKFDQRLMLVICSDSTLYEAWEASQDAIGVQTNNSPHKKSRVLKVDVGGKRSSTRFDDILFRSLRNPPYLPFFVSTICEIVLFALTVSF